MIWVGGRASCPAVGLAGVGQTTHPLHDVFVAWNVKLSHLVGRDISWDDTAPDPAEVEEANKKKREEEAASSGGRPMSVEERVLALLKGAPVMIFSKTYCPVSSSRRPCSRSSPACRSWLPG